MTTLAGIKIRRFREERSLSRAAFGAWYDTPGSTVQGWEEEGKRASAQVVNQIAGNGIDDDGASCHGCSPVQTFRGVAIAA